MLLRNSFRFIGCVLIIAFIGCKDATTPEETEESTEASHRIAEPDAVSVVSTERKEASGVDTSETSSTLIVGDPAPSLRIKTWIKGDAVDTFQTDQFYVVEFWATWCGPCRVSMPHLSELQERYQNDVVIIGISDEDERQVDGFLESPHESGKTWDDVVRYTMAVDQDEETTQAYLRASSAPGIPWAYIVGGDGFVEWIGSPFEIDEPLASIVAGDWDRAAAKLAYIKEQQRQTDEKEAMKIIASAVANQEFDAALEAVDGLIEKYPDQASFLTVRFRILLRAERTAPAISLFDDVASRFREDTRMLNAMAWSAVSVEDPDPELLEIALREMQRLHETAVDDADIVDTLARVHFKLGQLKDAIRWQERAVELDSDPLLAERLEEYREALSATEDDAGDATDEEEASVDARSRDES